MQGSIDEQDTIRINVGFAGGSEQAFYLAADQNSTQIVLKPKATLKDLIAKMKTDLESSKPELFFHQDSIRPGILVMVNNVDWELLDTLQCQLNNNDNVLFISTLHGG